MSELRQTVADAAKLRERDDYQPVDTRPLCPVCNMRCIVLMTLTWPVIAGVKPRPATEEMCGVCWSERMGLP